MQAITTREQLADWLGEGINDMTPAQVEQLFDAVQDINTRYDPEETDLDDNLVAIVAAMQAILGESDPEAVGRELADIRRAERRAYITALETALIHHRVHGAEKATIARTTGIGRSTLLEALGQRPKRRRG